MEKKPCNLREIVRAYLVTNGYDGLTGPDCACGCAGAELMTCDDMRATCAPGHDQGPRDGYEYWIES